MFLFALKNMAVKKVQILLILLSIVISAGVGVLAVNVSTQVENGITGNAGYYSAIIGPAGSETQLAMNTMYFTDKPLGTIPYALLSKLSQDMRVKEVVPFAMADSYNGFSVVGTSSAYLDGKKIKTGEIFSDSGVYEIVVGETVARLNDLKVGDTIYTSHSATEVHKQGFTVVGILEKSGTVWDKTVFTQLKTIWEVHEHEEEHEEEEHDHEEMDGMVCAILLRTTNPATAMQIVNEYNGTVFTFEEHSYSLQAIEPMAVVRDVLNEANSTRYIVFVLSAIILVMNVIIISTITLLNMYHSVGEIELMRLIGIGMKKINLVYVIQNALIGFVSIVLAFALSRLCLVFMQDYVADMGVVLSFSRVYPAEILVLVGVFVISVLPTMICTFALSRRNSVTE